MLLFQRASTRPSRARACGQEDAFLIRHTGEGRSAPTAPHPRKVAHVRGRYTTHIVRVWGPAPLKQLNLVIRGPACMRSARVCPSSSSQVVSMHAVSRPRARERPVKAPAATHTRGPHQLNQSDWWALGMHSWSNRAARALPLGLGECVWGFDPVACRSDNRPPETT